VSLGPDESRAQPIFVIVNVPLVHPDAPAGKLNVPLALVLR
jgi:hypothetical protein